VYDVYLKTASYVNITSLLFGFFGSILLSSKILNDIRNLHQVKSICKIMSCCVVWWKGVLKLAGFALCGGKGYCSCRVLSRVHGRRTEAVESCVVWREGVLKLSGFVLCGGKAY